MLSDLGSEAIRFWTKTNADGAWNTGYEDGFSQQGNSESCGIVRLVLLIKHRGRPCGPKPTGRGRRPDDDVRTHRPCSWVGRAVASQPRMDVAADRRAMH